VNYTEREIGEILWEAEQEEHNSEWAACVVKLVHDIRELRRISVPKPNPFKHVVKRTHVPRGWEDNPEEWWKHVESCTSCFHFYERPEHVDG
jgi:hypothetical protein